MSLKEIFDAIGNRLNLIWTSEIPFFEIGGVVVLVVMLWGALWVLNKMIREMGEIWRLFKEWRNRNE